MSKTIKKHRKNAATEKAAAADCVPLTQVINKNKPVAKNGGENRPAKRAAVKAPKPAKEKKTSGLDLAAKVLSESKEPMNAKTITEKVLAAGWTTNGKTPHATLFAAIIREIAGKGKASRFVKTDRGLFTANAGLERGEV